MDALRALQLLSDLAYLALGIAAVAAAVRSQERARIDVALRPDRRRGCPQRARRKPPARRAAPHPAGQTGRADLGPLLLGRLLPAELAQPDLAAARAARLPASDPPHGRARRPTGRRHRR